MSSLVPLPNEPPKEDVLSVESADIGMTLAFIVPPVLTNLVSASVTVSNATTH